MKHVLNGEDMTWKEAVIAAMEGSGRPVAIQEIGNYMLTHVIVEYPDTTATYSRRFIELCPAFSGDTGRRPCKRMTPPIWGEEDGW